MYSPNQKMFRSILYPLILIFLNNASPAFGQQRPSAQLDPAALNEFLSKAGRRVSEYKAKFIDITADEDQKVEEYDLAGKLKRQRRITSKLIIYQSQLDPSVTAEYRYIHAVDGVPVAKREERLVKFYDRLAKVDSLKKELDRVDRESRRYDGNYSVYNWTLNQGLTLTERNRALFLFTVAGREQINGRDVIVVQYQQMTPSPELEFKLSSVPPVLKGAETRYRGRVWLDAETAQIWREERDMMLQKPSWPQSYTFIRFEFEYVNSDVGILTPKKIVITTNNNGRTLPGNVPLLLLGGRATFEYSGFHRFEVTPDAKLESPAKP
ncbi:MAG: hypothetical protein QOD75_3338 [Blastocatellia bacterium]|jgi:hypothetical protein|nr:hypothetical protein [Blastocatellia bacterium]